jgi:hypothetical protein
VAGHVGAAVLSSRRTDRERKMPGNPREMIASVERRFPVRIKIAVPPSGLGQRHTQITAWLDEKLRCRRLGDDALGNARGAE